MEIRHSAQIVVVGIEAFGRFALCALDLRALELKAFSETDFTEDLKIINVPTLVMHGDDQIVPVADSALLSAKLLKKGTLEV